MENTKKGQRECVVTGRLRLAIVTTHPIQYYAPWFQLLAERGNVQVKVFYTWGRGGLDRKYDPDFQRKVEWDIPLLEGYEYQFLRNTARDPGSHHFFGIINPDLNRLLKEYRPDCILVVGWAFHSHLSCMRYFKGRIPVVFRGDSTLLDEVPGTKTLLRRIVLRWVYRHIDQAIYVGTNSMAYFKKHGLKETQLVLARHAVDNRRFREAAAKTEETEAFRRVLGIEPDRFVILFAGKLEPKKNPEFMLALAARMSDPKLVFLIVGSGVLETQIRTQAKDDPRIRLLPFQNQSRMPVVYAASQVFVLPSRGPNETWGLSVNEAMACGLPVVVSDRVGGAPDLVCGNGIIFGTNETERVKQYIEFIKDSPLHYSVTKEASLKQIQNFSFEQIAEAVEQTVLQLRKR